MAFAAGHQAHAPTLPWGHVVFNHAKLPVALHMQRLQPYFAAGMELLLRQNGRGDTEWCGRNQKTNMWRSTENTVKVNKYAFFPIFYDLGRFILHLCIHMPVTVLLCETSGNNSHSHPESFLRSPQDSLGERLPSRIAVGHSSFGEDRGYVWCNLCSQGGGQSIMANVSVRYCS